jgi:hypothetical protein
LFWRGSAMAWDGLPSIRGAWTMPGDERGWPKRIDFCPDDLREDQDCSLCGAKAFVGMCKALYNRPRRKPYIEVILENRYAPPKQ